MTGIFYTLFSKQLVLRTNHPQSRAQRGRDIYFFKPQHPPTISSLLSCIHFLKELLHRICLKVNYFLFGDHFINSHKLFSCLYTDDGRFWDLKGLKNQQTNKSKQNKNKEYKRRGELQAIDSHASNQLQQHLNRQPVFIGSKIRSDQSDSRRKWFRKIKRPRDFPFFL